MKPYVINETEGDFLTLDVVDNQIVLSIVNPACIEDQKSIPLRTQDIENFSELLCLMKKKLLERCLK